MKMAINAASHPCSKDKSQGGRGVSAAFACCLGLGVRVCFAQERESVWKDGKVVNSIYLSVLRLHLFEG